MKVGLESEQIATARLRRLSLRCERTQFPTAVGGDNDAGADHALLMFALDSTFQFLADIFYSLAAGWLSDGRPKLGSPIEEQLVQVLSRERAAPQFRLLRFWPW